MVDLTSARWRKSTRSGNQGDCVEVATNLLARQGVVFVRDSKDPRGGQIAVTARSWTAFTDALWEGALTP
ncbi:DUF397 domain-containing protein [Micromonospora sp. HUAS LYJ1]|uniref:DUF397 domain-containing protein n=1 Tax=Micromonospora sp. HUAS LYJ1 TaxID=3061626 RepID=UPI002672CEA7|nr:DUF397 domain-containing protein [Micromonospora sp. HUAS LYJ1]WKU05506.1 DUF397 domain-containing protein [Micromonospora sp. HUAS LYJ1]